MSTSKLQEFAARKLFSELPHMTIKENHWPEWLQNPDGGGLELDFYLPEIKTAIEIQGAQHYKYVPFFHGNYDGFLQQVRRDTIKRDTCLIEGIRLVEIDSEQDVLLFVQSIKQPDKPMPRFFARRILSPPKSLKKVAAKMIRIKNRLNSLDNQILSCEDSDKMERLLFDRDNTSASLNRLQMRINKYYRV